MLGPQMLHSGPTETRKWELSGYEPSLPVTEKSNPLTRDIDRADPEQIVNMLQECDAEIFQEELQADTIFQRLCSDTVVQTMVDVAKRVEIILKEPEDGLIVMSGCGTSGRIAFLLATSFNRILSDLQQEPIYSYIIAGGDKALLTSQEAPEDSPELGAHMLEKACAGKKHILFIGISCGLSAPFVAGQLDFCLNNLDVFTPVLIGFNPVHMSRNEPIQDWPFNFREVTDRMKEMQKTQKAFIINPAVGPEAISGSSRMKGGSATKILLESLLLAGHRAAFSNKQITSKVFSDWIRMYGKVHGITYSQSEKIAALVQKAGLSLQKKGHVYYLGWQTLGVMGIIDASECIPTFGADLEDIRGFVNKGFSEMNNKEGDLTSFGPQFSIDHKDFVNIILPTLNECDTVIFLFTVDASQDDLHDIVQLASQMKMKTSNLHAITHDLVGHNVPENINNMFTSVLRITWPSFSDEENSLPMKQQWELSTKWILNAISTGAHILKGKVYRNYMIDLKVTNSKLYKRAIGILQRFTSKSLTQCEKALLKAVYDVEELTDEMRAADVTKHTEMANTRDRVVPAALVTLQCGCTLSDAKSLLDTHSAMRDAVDACLTASDRICKVKPD